MRFAALQGSGVADYAAAGKKAAGAAADMFAIQRKSGPDYGKLAELGIRTRSAEKQAAMNAGATVAKAGINAIANVERVRIAEQAKADVRKIKSKGRKAGGVAALGSIAAAGFLAFSDGDEKAPPTNTQAKRDLINKYTAERDAAVSQRESQRTDYQPIGELQGPSTGTDNSSTNSSSTSASTGSSDSQPIGGDSAGKVTPPTTPPSSGDGSSGYDGTFQSVYNMAQQSGAKYPELVAAQWQLESASGTAISGTNNFFGIKAGANEDGTSKGTWEESNGQAYNTTARFKNFNSPQDSVNHLVSRWHQDYKGYKGVNNAASAADAAHSLRAQGYATDSKYATKLIDIMRRNGYGN